MQTSPTPNRSPTTLQAKTTQMTFHFLRPSACCAVIRMLTSWNKPATYNLLPTPLKKVATTEAKNKLNCKENCHFLWKPKFHYVVQNSRTLDTDLSDMSAVETLTPYLSKNSFAIIFSFVYKYSKSSFPSDFLTKIVFALLIFSVHTICPTNVMLFTTTTTNLVKTTSY